MLAFLRAVPHSMLTELDLCTRVSDPAAHRQLVRALSMNREKRLLVARQARECPL